MGVERHICRWNWQGQTQPVIKVEPDQPANRQNDGCGSPDGAFWVGTLLNTINADDSQRAGEESRFLTIRRPTALYRFDATRGEVMVLDVFGPGMDWQ